MRLRLYSSGLWEGFRPLAGLGVGLAFIPGVTLQAYFFLVGIEVPLGDTQFTAFGEIGLTTLTSPPGGNPARIGPAVGARFDLNPGE